MWFYPVSSFVVTGLIYISDRQLAGELSRVEWSRGTTNCEQINRNFTNKQINHTEWYGFPATTPRAFSLRSNRCAARPEGLGGSCVPGQGLVRIEGSQIKKKPYRMVWFLFNRQLSILPGRFQPSTFDV